MNSKNNNESWSNGKSKWSLRSIEASKSLFRMLRWGVSTLKSSINFDIKNNLITSTLSGLDKWLTEEQVLKWWLREFKRVFGKIYLGMPTDSEEFKFVDYIDSEEFNNDETIVNKYDMYCFFDSTEKLECFIYWYSIHLLSLYSESELHNISTKSSDITDILYKRSVEVLLKYIDLKKYNIWTWAWDWLNSKSEICMIVHMEMSKSAFYESTSRIFDMIKK